jgi:hypothetical protein
MAPRNDEERIFTICVIFSSLLVLGLAISRMTQAMYELSQTNADATCIQRQLIHHLDGAGCSRQESSRIIRFALFSYQRKKAMCLDPSVLELLSDALRTELTRSQRSKYLLDHPLFNHLSEEHPEVFHHVCAAFKTHVYADGDGVFEHGAVSERMFITLDGVFQLMRPVTGMSSEGPDRTRRSGIVAIYDLPELFCEVGLWSRSVHAETLTTLTFANAFSLSGLELAGSVAHFPAGTKAIYRYASEYVSNLWVGMSPPSDHLVLVNDRIPLKVAEAACDKALKKNETIDYSLESPAPSDELVMDFLERLADGTVTQCGSVMLKANVTQMFTELHETAGIYALVKQDDEWKRAVSSVQSALHLVENRYDLFTASQRQATRMSKAQWDTWQTVVKWMDMTPDILHALLVLLVIRGIAKVKSFMAVVPVDYQSQEKMTQYVMAKMPFMLPSLAYLKEGMAKLISQVLETHSEFNLAQFLQGENTPSQVGVLQEIAKKHGEGHLKFYLFGVICVMCGLGGGTDGSVFMNETNGRNALLGILCLQKMNEARPLAIYWGYITERARHLCLAVDTPENLAIARLACLTRATEPDQGKLAQAWYTMAPSDRDVLTNHFLADGVNEMAFMFLYLPLYLERCKKNDVVGLTRSFLVLVDIISILKSDGCTQECSARTMTVDLENVADFAVKVKSAKTFLSISSHIKLACAPALGMSAQRVLVSTAHWANIAKVDYHDEPANETLGLVRKLERRMDSLTYVFDGNNHGEGRRPSVSAAGMRLKTIQSVKEQQVAQQAKQDLARKATDVQSTEASPERNALPIHWPSESSTEMLRSDGSKRVQFVKSPKQAPPVIMVGAGRSGQEVDGTRSAPVGAFRPVGICEDTVCEMEVGRFNSLPFEMMDTMTMTAFDTNVPGRTSLS